MPLVSVGKKQKSESMNKKIPSMETPIEIPFGQHIIPTEGEFMVEAQEMLNLAKKMDKSIIFGKKEVYER